MWGVAIEAGVEAVEALGSPRSPGSAVWRCENRPTALVPGWTPERMRLRVDCVPYCIAGQAQEATTPELFRTLQQVKKASSTDDDDAVANDG